MIDRDALRQTAASHFNERFQLPTKPDVRLASRFFLPPPSVHVTSPLIPSFFPSSLFVHPPHPILLHASRIFEIEGHRREAFLNEER